MQELNIKKRKNTKMSKLLTVFLVAAMAFVLIEAKAANVLEASQTQHLTGNFIISKQSKQSLEKRILQEDTFNYLHMYFSALTEQLHMLMLLSFT